MQIDAFYEWFRDNNFYFILLVNLVCVEQTMEGAALIVNILIIIFAIVNDMLNQLALSLMLSHTFADIIAVSLTRVEPSSQTTLFVR